VNNSVVRREGTVKINRIVPKPAINPTRKRQVLLKLWQIIKNGPEEGKTSGALFQDKAFCVVNNKKDCTTIYHILLKLGDQYIVNC
jgi:hypothetical protein